MSKFVNPNSFSIGYNLSGQEFFDTIAPYKDYINSYFFSLFEDVHGKELNPVIVYQTLKECNRYGIKGNLLLNTYKSSLYYSDAIKLVLTLGDVNAVTVIDPDIATLIKKEFPDLEIHISVRYWDWVGDRDESIRTNPKETIQKLKEAGVDVVNISGELHFNNNNILNMIHKAGMKTKVIVNEGCIFKRENNYNKLSDCEDFTCKGIKCKRVCQKVFDMHPWMKLSRIQLFKEDLHYHQYDILKFATRMMPNETIKIMLDEWTSNERTKMLHDIYITDDKYPIFLDYIWDRAVYCHGDCNSCMRCKLTYDKLTKIG